MHLHEFALLFDSSLFNRKVIILVDLLQKRRISIIYQICQIWLIVLYFDLLVSIVDVSSFQLKILFLAVYYKLGSADNVFSQVEFSTVVGVSEKCASGSQIKIETTVDAIDVTESASQTLQIYATFDDVYVTVTFFHWVEVISQTDFRGSLEKMSS